ncbi:carbohydrate ABC transporter permease [Neomoorella humiferrea]|uniref:carbohydrate ABC transporter permease n=1 Tax=Neomoorella humiferrea TaxID=676965 RepID=UPI003D8AC13D
MSKEKRGIHMGKVLANIQNKLVVVLLLIWALGPVLWLLLTSIKPENAVLSVPPKWVFKPTLENYRSLITSAEFHRYLFNTLIVASTTSILTTSMGFLSAYAFTRFRFKGSTFLPVFYLVVRMVPRITLVVPFYVIMTKLSMINTKTALIVSYTTFALPFSIWMMIGFLKELPKELEEAAAVDGCNRLQILSKIVLPLAAPGLAATAIFSFLLGWNEFLFSFVLSGPESRTLPVMIAGFETDRGVLWGQFSAAAVSIMLPAIAIALVLQRHIVKGLTMGAVKG